MVSDTSMSSASLMMAVQSSVLKKSMDTNETLMSKLLNAADNNLQSQIPAQNSSSSDRLDIYA